MEVHQSDIQALADCPLKYEFRRRRSTRTPRLAPVMGTAFHAGLEYHYRARMDETAWTIDDSENMAAATLETELHDTDEELDDHAMTLSAETALKEAVILTEGEATDLVTGRIADYFEQERSWVDNRGCTVLAVEESFSFPIPIRPEHSVGGRWDMIIKGANEPNDISVVDWKTVRSFTKNTKWGPKQTVQPSLYIWAAQMWAAQTLDIDPQNNYLDWIADVAYWYESGPRTARPGVVFDLFTEERTDYQLKKALEHAAIAGDYIEGGGPFLPNPASNLCTPTWCDFWKTCGWGGDLQATETPTEIGSNDKF